MSHDALQCLFKIVLKKKSVVEKGFSCRQTQNRVPLRYSVTRFASGMLCSPSQGSASSEILSLNTYQHLQVLAYLREEEQGNSA